MASDFDRYSRILRFHNDLLAAARDGNEERWKINGWGSKSTQELRFERLLGAARFAGGSILDWGCGTGELYNYISRLGLSFTYLGIDLNPNMVCLARDKYGPYFETVPVEFEPSRKYNYIFASGIFQFIDLLDPYYYEHLIIKMSSFCTNAVSANFLSDKRSANDRACYELYLNAGSLLPLITRLTPNWLIDHSYHPGLGDFTICLLMSRSQRQWRRPEFGKVAEL
jgi:SAM-dependent methyltransferase